MLHADCVPQIIATLRMRFGRPEIIIDLLVTRIRQFPQVRENKLEMLVDFSVEVQNVCATKKTSKLDQYLNNPALTQELVSKLPSMVQTFWGMHKASLTNPSEVSSIPGNDDPRSLECDSTVWLVLEMFPEPQGGKMRRRQSLRNRWIPRTPSSPVASQQHGNAIQGIASDLVWKWISGIGQTKLYDLRDVHSVQSLDLPSQSLDISHLKAQHTHLRHLPLSGYDSAQPRLLIGLNNCKLGRVLRTKEGTTEDPIAEKTRLGWTIKGRSSNSVGDDITPNYHEFHICACEADENKEIMRLLEQCMWSDRGPRPVMNSKSVSNDDQLAIQYKDNKLPDSLPTALKRARCLYQKLTREPELAKEIRRQLDEYVKKGYALPISSEEAAAKTEEISLNTMLLKGPDQLAQLVPILHRLREKRIAIGGDIAEMFHQVRIHRIIDPYTQRRENYAMKVMTFGASCSPSCAQYVKNRNAESFKKEYPCAVKCILENHYVDDMLNSVDTEEEAISLARQVHYIHLQGGFLIGKWVSNSREVLSALGEGAPTLRYIPDVEKMTIPRCHMNESLMDSEVEMHTFVDAVSYIRFQNEAGINCSLLGSKTKVAPLRPTSIPRLELMGAVLGARLAQTLELSLGAKLSTRTFWTDSRTVLSWLRSDQRKYKQFVAFRVIEILDGTSVKDWRSPSSENVADDATKWNKGPDFNRESRWLNGPTFLWQERQFWPLTEAEEGDESGMELKAQFIGV
ncbi:uncharacterized protein [Drosophila bipectinata]|uniref:uncharacterized protein n=1 Tax=Drosophila bipectinata TaxID=42026 RepID=UPI0038B3E22A